ncbi:zinc finger FYVE domain-containing protein 1-like isoform X2 [Anthonomus grandis grandis]|uniref:zinc finger FYVE domain-containing protein 1-like isoform X2 n=1 Tax=Anthonomus grandis grandis TaxID=2921223 RepID=UPI002165D17E|nr:zinc finger FYVE domain-containing protein 1-like isoform X2 [Anthonomus grandis grandis]
MDSLVYAPRKNKLSAKSPLILNSLDPNINNYQSSKEKKSPPGKTISDQLDSLALELEDLDSSGSKGILLLDESENLKIKTEDAFLKTLCVENGKKVKVVSIFGNTGEGKSYTMNQVFFNGEQIFRTSSSQVSCTLGVWAKYDPNLNVICLDTEGLLGITKKENQRTRLLLKVLAVSDIIIYRTRAERLQRDLFSFLGGASNVFKEHFSAVLQKALLKNDGECPAGLGLGPGVIIFHETHHTNTLDNIHDSASVNQSAEDILRQMFANLDMNCDSFSFIKYVGVKTSLKARTSFESLKSEIIKQLESTEIRSPRDVKIIYRMLKKLTEKFQSPINDVNHQQYLMQFFTCPDKCQSCKMNCQLSMGHKEEGEMHSCNSPCTFQHQYQNCVYLCRRCHKNGERIIVKASYHTNRDTTWTSYFNYVWSGYVIECPKCGEIYRSRQHWYGNKNPEDSAVRTEIVHIWPGERIMFGSYNSAQKVVDGVNVFTDMVSNSLQHAKMISDWVNDKIAPSYWRPNHEIEACFKCNISFIPSGQNKIVPSKHHCRACGEGFCESCSSQRCPVPQKGWTDPVRVCDSCYMELEDRGQSLLSGLSGEEQNEVRARYISETVVNSISAVKSVLDIPKDFLKESARPSYWTPDNECIECVLCKNPFGPLIPVHHCRDCGKGVCDNCSSSRKAVPLKGWDSPVRVCDACR